MQQEIDTTTEDCFGFNPHAPDLSVLELNPPGTGHNDSLLREAHRARTMGASKEDTVARLSELYDPDRSDYDTAPRRAVDKAWDDSGEKGKRKPSVPPFDPNKLERFERMTMTDLVAKSPGEVETEPLDIIKALFKLDDLICIEGAEDRTAKVCKVSELTGVSDSRKFLNPSTFKSTEPTDGHRIARTNDNVAHRRYMVLEFDLEASDFKPDGHGVYTEAEVLSLRERFIACCMELAKHLPLVMVVDSGGKSVHFWFHCGEWTEAVEKVFAIACEHGADPRLRVLSQKARMPNVSGHDDRRDQKLLYYDPSKVGGEWDINGLMKEFAGKKGFDPKGVFYDSGSATFYADVGTHYRSYRQKTPIKNGVSLHLKNMGTGTDEMQKTLAEVFDDIEITRAVDWSGGLAGHRRGIMKRQGKNFLITTEPKIPDAVEGEFPLHKSIIDQAFPNHDARSVFLGWVSGGVTAIRHHYHHPAPMAVLAGPRNAGKSLLAHITKECLGGRSENPMVPWSGTLPWTDNLLAAELLLIDDDFASTDPRARKALGARFKSSIYAGDVSINTRNKSTISLRPVWRVMICCNETPENLAVIPPLEDGIEDKIMLLKVSPIETPMPAVGPEERMLFRKALARELPAFLHYLENFKVPSHLGDSRDGVTAWKDPELLHALNEIAPETQMESLIAMAIKANGFDSFDSPLTEEGKWMSAADIQSILQGCGTTTADQARNLLRHAPNVGKYLMALSKKGSPYVSSKEPKQIAGIKCYLITAPVADVTESDCF